MCNKNRNSTVDVLESVANILNDYLDNQDTEQDLPQTPTNIIGTMLKKNPDMYRLLAMMVQACPEAAQKFEDMEYNLLMNNIGNTLYMENRESILAMYVHVGFNRCAKAVAENILLG